MKSCITTALSTNRMKVCARERGGFATRVAADSRRQQRLSTHIQARSNWIYYAVPNSISTQEMDLLTAGRVASLGSSFRIYRRPIGAKLEHPTAQSRYTTYCRQVELPPPHPYLHGHVSPQPHTSRVLPARRRRLPSQSPKPRPGRSAPAATALCP